MPQRLLSLRFPAAGVVRSTNYLATSDFRSAYPAAWACNVVLSDAIERRMRGGSRPGLTNYLGERRALVIGRDDTDAIVLRDGSTVVVNRTSAGSSITDMTAVQASSATGTKEYLVTLADGYFGCISDGAYSSTEEAGAGFLIAGHQYVYSIDGSSIVRFDPKLLSTEDLEASDGAIPAGCTFGAIYRDRMVLAGYDNAIRFSRQGDYTDWELDIDISDPARSMAIQLAQAGLVGDTATAVIPCLDKHLICATTRSLWVLSGDPATGTMRRISDTIGVISSKAWCQVGARIYFLGEDGLYRVDMDGGNFEAVSEEKVPEELRDIDTSTTTISMGYDADRMTVHIYLTTDAGSDTHWFYELLPQAFWPVRLQNYHSPVAVCQYDGNLVLACSDGYLRTATGDDDDGDEIESHILIGPLQQQGVDSFGLINRIHGMLAQNSGTVTWRIVTGDTAEEAAANGKAAIEAYQAGSSYDSYVQSSGTWTAGRSRAYRPRVRAMWACIWLQSTDQWAYENVTLVSAPHGSWR